MHRVVDILNRCRIYIDDESTIARFLTGANGRQLVDDAEAHFRCVVGLPNIDMLVQREGTFSYTASAASVDLARNEVIRRSLGGAVERIRRVLDETGSTTSPIPVEEVSWGDLEEYDAPPGYATSAIDGPLVFAWSGGDFALRPRPTAARTIRLRYVPRRRPLDRDEDIAEALPSDFGDLYSLWVAILAKGLKAGEDTKALEAIYDIREKELLAFVSSRSEETARYIDYVPDAGYDTML